MGRILVVANQTVGGEDLARVVRARMAEGPCEFWLLVPATLPARTREDLATDVVMAEIAATSPQVRTDAYELARNRLRDGLQRLRGLGATVQGDVGDANALRAIERAVARRQFDEIIVSTLPSGISRWLRQDLPRRVERKFKLPLTVVTASPGKY